MSKRNAERNKEANADTSKNRKGTGVAVNNMEDELATLGRVRNRLAATTGDPHQLARVWTALGPKLVSRLNRLAALTDTTDSKNQETAVVSACMEHVQGMFRYVRDRVILLRTGRSSAATQQRQRQQQHHEPWIRGLWDCLLQSSSHHPLTWHTVLSLLEVCVDASSPFVLEYALPALETLHAALLAPQSLSNTGNENYNNNPRDDSLQVENWNLAGWIVLEAIAQQAGLPTWDNHLDQQLDWKRIEETPAASASIQQIVQQHGNVGLVQLLLDVCLFHPGHGDSCPGLSAAAWKRLQYRRRPEQDAVNQQAAQTEQEYARLALQRQRRGVLVPPRHRAARPGAWTQAEVCYLHHVQLAVVRYVLPAALLSEDQAMVVAVLLSQTAASTTRVGPYAAEYLWSLVGGRRLVRVGNRFDTPAPPPCSLAAATALLTLVVGDGIAREAYQRRPQEKTDVPVLRHDPSAVVPSLQRTPLPSHAKSHVLQHLRECLQLPPQVSPSLRLFLALAERMVATAAGPRDYDNDAHVLFQVDPPSSRLDAGLRWTMHLWYKLFQQYGRKNTTTTTTTATTTTNTAGRSAGISSNNHDEEWTLYVQRTSWTTAIKVLNQISDVEDQRLHRGRHHTSNNNTTQRLIEENRRQIGKKSPVLQDCLMTRREAYVIIGHLICAEKIRCQNQHGEPIDFGPLICLLTCLGNDINAEVQQALRVAAQRFVDLYQREATTIVMNHRQARKLMNALLFPLLNAATSPSDAAREMSVVVTAHVLGQLDPLPALYLCQFLAGDSTGAVSKLARASLKKLQGLAPDLAKPVQVSYINLAHSTDLQALKDDMENRTALMASTLGISADATFFLLRKTQFSVAQTSCALQNDYQNFIRECGLYHRLTKGTRHFHGMDAMEHLCKICYETVPGNDVFALSCGHSFCKLCWIEAMNAAFGDSETIVAALKCPQHQCQERLIRSDLETIAPNSVEKWDKAAIEDFVHRSPDYAFCPGADCTVVACLASDVTKNHPASCRLCDTSFCFQCGRSPHRPATCDVVKRYETIMQQFNELEHVMKECPSCSVRIQKNGGCNHVSRTELTDR